MAGNIWFEKPNFSGEDLRCHADEDPLEVEAGMTKVLHNMSQHLLSRTQTMEQSIHEVISNADRVVTSITNTANTFHMLANAQFVENRTYQDDDAMLASEKPLAVKIPPSEKEVCTRCREALIRGVSLVKEVYERHEIEDSDSEDDGSSFLPVFLIKDRYASVPLPHIVGSDAFRADDKAGLGSACVPNLEIIEESSNSASVISGEIDGISKIESLQPVSSRDAINQNDFDREILPTPIAVNEKILFDENFENDSNFSTQQISKSVKTVTENVQHHDNVQTGILKTAPKGGINILNPAVTIAVHRHIASESDENQSANIYTVVNAKSVVSTDLTPSDSIGESLFDDEDENDFLFNDSSVVTKKNSTVSSIIKNHSIIIDTRNKSSIDHKPNTVTDSQTNSVLGYQHSTVPNTQQHSKLIQPVTSKQSVLSTSIFDDSDSDDLFGYSAPKAISGKLSSNAMNFVPPEIPSIANASNSASTNDSKNIYVIVNEKSEKQTNLSNEWMLDSDSEEDSLFVSRKKDLMSVPWNERNHEVRSVFMHEEPPPLPEGEIPTVVDSTVGTTNISVKVNILHKPDVPENTDVSGKISVSGTTHDLQKADVFAHPVRTGVKTYAQPVVKRDLFGSSDSDDDLFGTGTAAIKVSNKATSLPSHLAAVSTVVPLLSEVYHVPGRVAKVPTVSQLPKKPVDGNIETNCEKQDSSKMSIQNVMIETKLLVKESKKTESNLNVKLENDETHETLTKLLINNSVNEANDNYPIAKSLNANPPTPSHPIIEDDDDIFDDLNVLSNSGNNYVWTDEEDIFASPCFDVEGAEEGKSNFTFIKQEEMSVKTVLNSDLFTKSKCDLDWLDDSDDEDLFMDCQQFVADNSQIDQLKLKEEQKIRDELKLKEEQKIRDELKLKEEQKIRDELKLKEEQKIRDELKLKEEQKIRDELKLKEEQKIRDELKLKEEQKIRDELKLKEEQKIRDELKLKEEQKIRDELKLKEEQKIRDELKLKEEQKIRDELKLKEEQKIRDELKFKEEQKIRDELKLKEEQKIRDELKLKEEQKIRDEQKLKEEHKLKEDAKLMMDEQNLKDELKINYEKMASDEQRMSEQQHKHDFLKKPGKLHMTHGTKCDIIQNVNIEGAEEQISEVESFPVETLSNSEVQNVNIMTVPMSNVDELEKVSIFEKSKELFLAKSEGIKNPAVSTLKRPPMGIALMVGNELTRKLKQIANDQSQNNFYTNVDNNVCDKIRNLSDPSNGGYCVDSADGSEEIGSPPIVVKKKPPIGGVALFNNAELMAKLGTRKVEGEQGKEIKRDNERLGTREVDERDKLPKPLSLPLQKKAFTPWKRPSSGGSSDSSIPSSPIKSIDLERGSSFDEQQSDDPLPTLTCITKHRVRITQKRRPKSRPVKSSKLRSEVDSTDVHITPSTFSAGDVNLGYGNATQSLPQDFKEDVKINYMEKESLENLLKENLYKDLKRNLKEDTDEISKENMKEKFKFDSKLSKDRENSSLWSSSSLSGSDSDDLFGGASKSLDVNKRKMRTTVNDLRPKQIIVNHVSAALPLQLTLNDDLFGEASQSKVVKSNTTLFPSLFGESDDENLFGGT